jgi:trimeric autotransporter adhesin
MKFFPALQIGYAWLYNLKAGLVTQASTAAYESAPLGAELLSADGWTSTDWTGDWASGWDHTTGNTTALLNSLAAVSGNYYQIAYTVTGRTAGTFTITFGGVTSEAISATGAWGPKATSTGSLSITPTSTFDGTIVISIKQITGTYAPVYRILNSAAGSALEIRSTTNALCNTFIGIGVGRYNTTGSYNTALGYQALFSNTTGNYNTALGAQAFYSNTTGSYNTALGYQALFSNTTGSYNTAFGYLAFYSNTTGNYNTALGALALYSNTTGGYNTAFGYLALYSNTTGGYNTALGYQALYSNTTGGYNTAFGYLAGRYISSGAANQTSGNSVYLGYDTRSSADGNTNETVLGNTAVGNGSNTVTLGNTSVTGWYMGATKLIGAQGAAVDDATGAGDVVAQLNALLARIRAHGLIAT